MATLNKNEVTILQYLYENEMITVKIASEILDRSKELSRRILKSLEQKNILTWHGLSPKDPTQYYTLKK